MISSSEFEDDDGVMTVEVYDHVLVLEGRVTLNQRDWHLVIEELTKAILR